MKKTLLTAFLVVLITGSLFGSSFSLLRAGRDKIMMGRNSAKKQFQLKPAQYEQVKPVYYGRKSYRHAKPLGKERKGILSSFNAYHFSMRIFELRSNVYWLL